MICEICNKRDVHILYDRKATAAGRDIYQCEHCNLIFTSPHDYVHQLCDDSQIKNLYLEMSEFREPVLVDNLQQIERIKGKGRILDIGCYIGSFIRLAKQSGWDCAGLEPSDYVSKYVAETFGITVLPVYLRDANFGNYSFDVVTMFHVLEHIIHPHVELLEIKRILKPNGLLVIEVPKASHYLYRLFKGLKICYPPEHYYYFTPDTIEKLLHKSGFKIVKIVPGKIFVSPYRILWTLSKIVERLCGRRMGLVNKLKLGRKGILLNSGKNMLVFSQAL